MNRDPALDVWCPTCYSVPGTMCFYVGRSRYGVTMKKVHGARSRKWYEQLESPVVFGDVDWPYEKCSTEQLKAYAREYEASVVNYKRFESEGWYHIRGWWCNNVHIVMQKAAELQIPYEVKPYDATEDLAFLYTDLGRIYNILSERQS